MKEVEDCFLEAGSNIDMSGVPRPDKIDLSSNVAMQFVDWIAYMKQNNFIDPRNNGKNFNLYDIIDHSTKPGESVWGGATNTPFGMTLSGMSYSSSPENKFLFNGKELQSENGLDWYDFGFRMYDAQLGRWHVTDPLAEIAFNKTPYHFVSNNPINRIDPNGLTDVSNDTDDEGYGATGSNASCVGYRGIDMHGNAMYKDDLSYFSIDHNGDKEEENEDGIISIEIIPLETGEEIAESFEQGVSDGVINGLTFNFENTNYVFVEDKDGILWYVHVSQVSGDGTIDNSKSAMSYISGQKLGEIIGVFSSVALGEVGGTVVGNGLKMVVKQVGRVVVKNGKKYLYHYTSKAAAQSISKNGLKIGKDGYLYLTNNSTLKPLQAKIELALPANRAVPNSVLRINSKGLNPTIIRRVQGNLPGLGAGGGTEFLFNHTIPANNIKIIW